MVVVPGFGGSCLVPTKGAQTGNSWLTPRALLDPWAWVRINAVEYTRGREFVSLGQKLEASGFGTEDGVCDLCPDASALSSALRLAGAGMLPMHARYFAPLRDALRQGGVSRMYSAPYDFRRILDARVLAAYRLDLVGLIERAVMEAGGRRSVLVTHSMGSVLANHLLLTDPEWLKRNVAYVVDVCPNSEGSVLALDGMLNGRLCVGGANGRLCVGGARGGMKDSVRRMSRNNAGLILSLPYPMLLDYEGLVGDAWRTHAEPIMASLRPPGLPGDVGHVLIHGVGHDTPTSIGAGGELAGMADGDGVVLRASDACPSRLVGPDSLVIQTGMSHSAAPSSALVAGLVRVLTSV